MFRKLIMYYSQTIFVLVFYIFALNLAEPGLGMLQKNGHFFKRCVPTQTMLNAKLRLGFFIQEYT